MTTPALTDLDIPYNQVSGLKPPRSPLDGPDNKIAWTCDAELHIEQQIQAKVATVGHVDPPSWVSAKPVQIPISDLDYPQT